MTLVGLCAFFKLLGAPVPPPAPPFSGVITPSKLDPKPSWGQELFKNMRHVM